MTDHTVHARSARIGRIARYAVLTVAAPVYGMPLLVMVMTSRNDAREIGPGSVFRLPLSPDLDAWRKAWFDACIGLDCRGIRVGFWNSVRISIPSLILSVLAGHCAPTTCRQRPLPNGPAAAAR
jgi:glucose/mannose transport system permease protein